LRVIQTNPSKALFRTGDEMKIDERLNKMSKEQLINLVKEIKITCESNRHSWHKTRRSMEGVCYFILRMIKGEI